MQLAKIESAVCFRSWACVYPHTGLVCPVLTVLLCPNIRFATNFDDVNHPKSLSLSMHEKCKLLLKKYQTQNGKTCLQHFAIVLCCHSYILIWFLLQSQSQMGFFFTYIYSPSFQTPAWQNFGADESRQHNSVFPSLSGWAAGSLPATYMLLCAFFHRMRWEDQYHSLVCERHQDAVSPA